MTQERGKMRVFAGKKINSFTKRRRGLKNPPVWGKTYFQLREIFILLELLEHEMEFWDLELQKDRFKISNRNRKLNFCCIWIWSNGFVWIAEKCLIKCNFGVLCCYRERYFWDLERRIESYVLLKCIRWYVIFIWRVLRVVYVFH